MRLAGDPQLAHPRAHLREPRGVQDRARAEAQQVLRLLHRLERARPRQVEADAVLVPVADEPQPRQRVEHLDPVRAHPLVEPVVAERVREPHRPLPIALAHRRVRVDHPEVRVDAQAGDEEQLGRARMRVEVAAVVEVAVGARDVGERQRRLVDRELVERDGHQKYVPASIRCSGSRL
jgi:hypothetical protein